MASSDDGILERRATSPMGTACLIVAFFMLLGAILFPMVEIGEIRAGIGQRPSEEIAGLRDRHLREFTDKVDAKIRDLQGVSGQVQQDTGVSTPEDGDGDADDADADAADDAVDDADTEADDPDADDAEAVDDAEEPAEE